MAAEAGDLRRGDGKTTADKVHDAADAGIKPRSRWEKFKDGVAAAWHVIVEIAKVVVLVLGVVALIIGGPLAWIVFAAALIVLADTIPSGPTADERVMSTPRACCGGPRSC